MGSSEYSEWKVPNQNASGGHEKTPPNKSAHFGQVLDNMTDIHFIESSRSSNFSGIEIDF